MRLFITEEPFVAKAIANELDLSRRIIAKAATQPLQKE
jgi:hypothetical protein